MILAIRETKTSLYESHIFQQHDVSQVNTIAAEKVTTTVADIGSPEALHLYQPQDMTTNPPHILAASKLPQSLKFINEAITYAVKKSNNLEEQARNALLRLLISLGCEILNHVPGRVLTEIDAISNFDKE